MSSANNNDTCIICYEKLSLTNNCTTVCGHRFCVSCLLSRSSNRKKCPYCNNSLILTNDTHRNNEDPQLQLNGVNLYPEEANNLGCVDDIAKILIDKGVTMVDVLSYFDNRYNSRTPQYRHCLHDCHIYYKEYMEQTIEEAFKEVDR